MQMRQITAVLVGFIVILAAALYVVTWSGDDGESETAPASTTTEAPTPTSTAAPTTTTTTTTTIPVECTFETNNSDDSSSDEAPAEPDATEPDATEPDAAEEDTGAEEEEAPILPTLGTNSSVSTVGLDTVTFGMTVNQAEIAAGTDLIACSLVSDCYRVTPVQAPKGISFVVHEGTIERVDIAEGPITTRSGMGIGTEASVVEAAFGDQLETSENGDGSTDLIFVPRDESDAEFRVIFTVRDSVVETFRAGRIPLALDRTPCDA